MSDFPDAPLRSVRPDPQRLSLLLREAGWQIVGQRKGAYVRLAPPGEFNVSVLVPLDRSAPEYNEVMADALADIERLMARDVGTSNVIALLTAEPTDGFRFRAESTAPRGLIAWTHGEQLIHNSRLILASGAKAYMGRLGYFGNRFGQFANRYLDHVLMGQTAPGSYIVSAFVPVSGFVPLSAAGTSEAETDKGLFPIPTEVASTRAIGISTWTAAVSTAEALEHYRSTGSLSAFEDLVPRGVSHEMTMAMQGLLAGSDGAEFSVEWNPAIPPPKNVGTARIELRPSDSEVLSRASNDLLAKAAAPTRITIVWWVHLLTRKEAGGPGVIGVENLSHDKPHKVRVRLNDDDYHRALTAHDEDLAVAVEGVVEREGNVSWIYKGRLVSVLASIEEIKAKYSARSRKEVPGQLDLDI